MSVSASSQHSRNTDIASLPNVLFPSSGSFRYASQASANSENEQPANSGTGESVAPHLFIWGTDVSVDVCKKKFISFLKESRFTLKDAEMDEANVDWHESDTPRSLYLTKLEEIAHVPSEPYLTLNCAHLKEFDMELYRQMVFYPSEVIQIFDMAANEVFQELFEENMNEEQIIISVRPFNIDQTYSIRDLCTRDVGKLVTISGMITRCSALIPEMTKGFFKCSKCQFTREVLVENGKITEPHVCTSCNSKFCFRLIHSRSKFIDRQLIKIQESPDDMPKGQTPCTVSLVACADLVDKVNPGDRVLVTGIFKASPTRVIFKQRRLKGPFRTSIDVIHFRRVKAHRLHDDSSELRFSPERVDRLKELASQPDIYDRLSESLCPTIFGHEDVKKGVLLQLFGGARKEPPGRFTDPKMRHFRSDINIMLCGDPGTSKSQILQYVYKLVPRGQYTSGKGSSAVGLTAYVTRDVDTNQLVLQTGSLVMCDGGICCIDEFDKMAETTRSVLHEVMEQQTLSIAKAGIVTQLNARTSVLAAANPIESGWNVHKNIVDNLKLPETLISRFDLIFLLLDSYDQNYDRKLAEHLINLYHGDDEQDVNEFIPHDLLKDYVAYARVNIQPKLSANSCQLLTEKYLGMRANGRKAGHVKSFPRNLESLIRLSEAHARMRLSDSVEEQDICEAARLVEQALQVKNTDPTTGKIIYFT